MPTEMTLRDHFAAAALTGLLAQGDDGSFSEEWYARAAYRWADAMLRCRAGGDCPGPDNAPNLDAAPAATADLPDERPPNAVSANGETPCAASRDGSGTGDTQEPVAWGVVDDRGLQLALHPTPEHASHYARNFGSGLAAVVPLYRHLQPTLTGAEREAIERGYCSLMGVEDMSAECSRWDAEAADTLRGLLERTK